MKTTKKICTIISLLCGLHVNAQPGDSCNGASQVSFSQNPDGTNFSFAGSDHLWLKFIPDSSDVEFRFLPDSVSTSTGIEEIHLYTGTDCNDLDMVWSKSYSDSGTAALNAAIYFELPPSGSIYFIDIRKVQGATSGFKLHVGYNELLGGCPTICDNLVANGRFNDYSAFCVGYSNNNQCANPFNGGCVCGWGATHGTPNFNPPLLYPLMGVIDVGGVYGEGIFQNLQTPVVAGRHYLLSFDYQNSYSVNGYTYHLYAQFTNSGFNPGTCFELIPVSGWDVPNTPVSASANWKTVRSCFVPNTDYTTLRFYPKTNSHSTEWVSVDNVSLEWLDQPLTDVDIYCGETAVLCPPCGSVNPAVHYLWSNGQTTSCISVSPLATTLYNVAVTVIDNGNVLCSFSLPVTVNVHPPSVPAMVIGSTSLCNFNSSQTYCFSSYGASSFSYVINPPNTALPFGNCITVNWTNVPATCATIDVTATSAGCSTVGSFQICALCQGNPSLLTFCDETASNILNNPLYASYISGGNVFTVPPGKWVSIHGTFTVDVPFVFNNSDVRFGEDAKVVVNTSQVFEVVNQCHLHSCDGVNMWDGIYTNDPLSLVYIHDGNNLIEDAKNAVISNQGGNFEINATVFNNNYIGILVNATNINHQGRVWGCTFKGTGTLLSPYSNFCAMNYPPCGIQVDQVNHIQIGEPVYYGTYGRNLFQNLLCGISSNVSGLDVFTSEFKDILFPASNCFASQGCGIYANGLIHNYREINIGNVSPSEQCFFDNCKTGIFERTNCYGEILSNTFTHCENGIANIFSGSQHSLVKGNHFDDFKKGIFFFNAINQLQYGLEIYENIFNAGMTSFNAQTYGKEAINVSNAVSASTNLWVVGNIINYSQVGVFVRNVWEPCQIRSNTINFDILPQDALAVGRHHGIDCENDNGLEIDANLIKWKNQPVAPVGFKNFMNGISVNFGSNVNAISGGISENKIGPYPAVNTGTTYGMGTGINISNDCSGLSLYCNKMTRCEQGVTFNNALLRQQGYQDHQLNWYSNGNTFSFTPGQGGVYRIGGTVFQSVDWAYIGSLETPVPYQFLTITPHPTTYTMTHCQPPSPADEEIREDDFGTLIDTSTQQLNPDYEGYEEQINYATKEKFYASVKSDSSILDAGTPDDIVYANLYDQLDQTNIAKIQDVKSSIDSMNYSLALQKLLMVLDSNMMEHNKKVAMQVFIETFASGSDMDSAHAALLEPISNMHPVIGGEAVFWACAMLDKDVNNDLPPLRKAGLNKVLSNQPNVRIFPNPAKDILYVNYNSMVPLAVDIIDITGKVIMTKNLPGNADYGTVNTAAIQAGAYSMRVVENGKTIFTDKLIIIR